MRTVRVSTRRELPPMYAMAPGPGDVPVAVWRINHDDMSVRRDRHIHDFPVLVYLTGGGGWMADDRRRWSVSAGDVFVVAPGDVMGPFDLTAMTAPEGWAVAFTPDALGPDVPGSYLAWRSHPMLFPFVRGGASGGWRLSVPPDGRAEWEARIQTMKRELAERRDGYREAVAAHLVLLLVAVSRLAADVVDDLRVNREPLLAEVFAVIENRYAEPLSLRDVAAAVSMSPGHLTSTVRRRTGRTVQEWIAERRMVQARRLLVGTELPVGEVGRRVGYRDPGYFARVFRQAHDVSPARWRGAGRLPH